MQLGETSVAQDLIPGTGSVAHAAGRMYGYSTVLTEAGNGLARITSVEGT